MPGRSPYTKINKFVEYKSIKVEIKLDKKGGDFVAEYASSLLSAPTMGGIESLVREAIATSLDVTWTPVIHVRGLHLPYAVSDPFVGFSVDRLYITKFPNGEYKRAAWQAGEKGDFLVWCTDFYWSESVSGVFSPPVMVSGRYDREPEFWLPYTDETWEHLKMIQEKIKQLKAELYRVLANPDELARLAAPLLPALSEPKQ